MKNYDLVIIGGGVAGMQAAITAAENGLTTIILERDKILGGKVAHKYSLFPTFASADELIERMTTQVTEKDEKELEVSLNSTVLSIDKDKSTVTYEFKPHNNKPIINTIQGKAIVIASGYSFFDATLKQEYGYQVYDNVVTSFELEEMFKKGEILTADGRRPESIAFIHCVGSRDSKVGNEHCSRVCCVTGVKQAIELCKMMEGIRIFNFYMDMRMFGIGYEEMYKSAQEDYQVRFIRGRVSELSQSIDKRVRLKAEDTLIARPIAITVDMVVLLVGMCGGDSNKKFAKDADLTVRENGFLRPINAFDGATFSGVDNIFYAGCIESPKNIAESINHATMAVISAKKYINSL